MPVLDNARHERFAQEVVKGNSQAEAYVLAGYQPDTGAASRLSANVSVQARIAELKARAAARTEITVASISQRLLKIAEAGEDATEAPMLSVARAALMDVAKLNGLIVDKREHFGKGGGPIEYANLTEEEIDARLAALAAPPAPPQP